MSELLTLHSLLGKYDGEQSLHQVLMSIRGQSERKLLKLRKAEVVFCSFYMDAMTYCMPAFSDRVPTTALATL